MIVSPWAALVFIGWRMWAGVNRLAGRHSTPAEIKLASAQFEDAPRFARECAGFLGLGFERVGDYEVSTRIGPNSRQRTFLRAFLAPDRSAFAVVYELVNLTVLPGAAGGAMKIWANLVSRRSAEESITTSSGEPPLSLHDPNPQRPVHSFPGASPSQLWERHRALAGASLAELVAGEFVPLFEQGWTRTMEFQESRGLYRRSGDRFVATSKLALRSVLEFHLMLRHRQGPAYALAVFGAVTAAAAAMGLANLQLQPLAVPVAAALAGGVFAVLFRHFELPGALFLAAMALMLGRDDPFAILAFLGTLVSAAALLQRRRAAKAAARLAA